MNNKDNNQQVPGPTPAPTIAPKPTATSSATDDISYATDEALAGGSVMLDNIITSNSSNAFSNNIQNVSTGNRKLDEAITKLLKDLSNATTTVSKNKFTYENFMDKCNNISYQNKGLVGVNFYVYKWFSNDEVKANPNLVTDVGCDNYKDIDLEGLSDCSFAKNGGDIYINEAKKIKEFQDQLNKEINRIVEGYTEFSNSLAEISSELSEINIPKVNLSNDFSKYKEEFEMINTALQDLINGGEK